MRTVILYILLALPYIGLGQQQIVFSGVIKDAETGVVIRGAVISLQKAKISTMSDMDGRYKLAVNQSDKKDTLSVRNIGYMLFHQSVALSVSKRIEVGLSRENTVIEEVEVNTGYQRQNKRLSTGAVELIGKDELSYGTGSNLLDRIEGLFSGGAFDRTDYNYNGIPKQPDVTLRGASSLMARLFL